MAHGRASAVALAIVCIAASASGASLTPDREICSVGDQVQIQLREDVPILSLATLVFSYALGPTATYVPNSVIINGTPASDGGRVLVTADSIQVSITLPFTGTHTVALRVRAVGAIGQPIVHRGAVRLGSNATVALYGPATWIEDENAYTYVPTLAADTFISQAESNFNFGRAPQIVARTSSERRPLLQFAFGPIPLPVDGGGVHAAYLELWPTVAAGSSVTLSAHRVRSAWTEGSQNGTACLDGATWTSRNCVTSWTSGGDFEAIPVGSATTDPATRFVAIDVTTLVQSWVDATKPNQGLILTATAAGGNRTLAFPSREGASGPVPAARLVVIMAPTGAYTDPAVNKCHAEIVPTKVLKGTRAQSFTYSFDASFSGSSTGVERFAIAVPSGFTFVALDSVRLEGTPLRVNTDAVLAVGEFENWGGATGMDVRFLPLLVDGVRRLDVVFRADCPAVLDPVGKEFLSVVDHDRRGFPAQSTTRGDANGRDDEDTWTVVTHPGSIVDVEVVPGDTTVAAGLVVPYHAFATYSDSSVVDMTAVAAWSVAPATLGTFGGEPGVLTTAQPGAGTVQAVVEGIASNLATLQVGAPIVLAVEVSPSSASAPVGVITNFQADARYSDGSVVRVTDTATWESADTGIVTWVGPGRVRGIATGTARIDARYGAHTGSATLDVTPAQLTSIAVTPADTALALGYAVQLHATGTYTDGGTSDVSAIAVWAATPNGILDIDASGLATTLGEGTARVTASVGSVTSPQSTVTVLPAAVVALAIVPPDTTVALGFDVQYRATATYSNGDRHEVTSQAQWATAPPGVATIDAGGRAHTVAAGSTSVVASLDGVTSPAAALTVGPAVVVGLDGAPDAAVVPLGDMHAVQSTATYSDGSQVDVTATATWQSLDPAVADFSSPGQVQTFATGSARLVHDFAGVQGDTLHLNVTTAALDSVVVSPCGLVLPPGVTRQLVATAHFSDGSTQDATAQATWTSSDPMVASVDEGRVTAVATGSTQITATVLGVPSAPCALGVDPAAVTELAVVPADTTIAIGATVPYRALGSVGADVYDLTSHVGWSVVDSTIATITPGGTATARASGVTAVRATYASRVGQATLRVAPATLVRVDVLPASTTVRVGTTKPMTARAVYSNAAVVDVTAQAAWASDAPTLVHIDAAGVARGLALGTAGITATYLGVTSAPASITVLPAVQLEALAIGNEVVQPGASHRAVLALRFVNRYLDVRRITALRVAVAGPAAQVALYKDDGDGVFQAATDVFVAASAPSGGIWSASGLTVDLAVGTPKTLFVTAEVSATTASHGDVVDATLVDVGDVFWQQATAVVGAFPLASFGELRVRDLALAQLVFDATSDSVLTAAATGLPLFTVQIPSDGLRADVLDHVELVQQGTARPDIDLAGVRLQSDTGGWHDVATFVASGGDRWVATGIGLAVPPGGERTRLVVDIGDGAASNRSVQFALPALACRFASGRLGPVDVGWTEPAAHRIDSPPVLVVAGRDVASGQAIPRDAARVAVLGLALTARGVVTDSLATLRFDNTTTGVTGPAADPNAEIAAAELWIDTDADGILGGADAWIASVAPGSGTTIEFGAATSLDVALAANVPIHMLVSVSPDSNRVRDGERLALRFAGATTRGGLTPVALPPLETSDPPVIDGQAASGYQVRAIGNALVTAGATGVVVLDCALPTNGFETDTLERLRIANAGSATTSDIAALRLCRDDGDGRYDAGDVAVATLTGIEPRTWEASGLALALVNATERWFVVADLAASAVVGRTFEAEVALSGVEVASGNDGPVDRPLQAGGSVVVTASDQVLWVSGVAGSHAVQPAAARQSVLVLETLNTYATPRTLQSLTVAVRGTAAPFEYDIWELVADANQNGSIDADETPLALATVSDDAVHFDGFTYLLQPLQQQRLLVAYALAPGLARDGAVIDAAVERAADFGYAPSDGLNSAGQDEVDGHVAVQIANATVTSQSLGGGETNVLALDVVLPSNGWEGDVLNAITIGSGPAPEAAQFGPDFTALRLWRESDVDFTGARFDPSQDVLLQTLMPGSALRFDGLSVPIPAGGRRFYVTVDVAPAPTEGRTIQLRIPVDGIAVASGNDGPMDRDVVATATHRMSSSPLLATVISAPIDPSVTMPIDVTIVVRNRGATPLVDVVPHALTLEPPLASMVISGPQPPQLALAPSATDTLHYRVRIDAAGTTQFVAVVGTQDSTVLSEPASGPFFDVREVATALVVSPRTNLPAVVSRGQTGTTPVIWNLAHADSDPFAGSIRVHSLVLEVETATGQPQSAADVFERLEIRSGGTVRLLMDSVPDTHRVHLRLDPPVVIGTGEALDLPLQATIASAAAASAFQLRIADASAVEAVDAGSGIAVAITADLPWTTPATAIRSVATGVDVAVTPQVPAGVDRGQRGVPIATLRFALPGNPGESEARVVRLAVAFRDSTAAPLDPQHLFDRFEVWSGTSLLLGADAPSGNGGLLLLPLTIPRPFASGAPEDIRLVADMHSSVAADRFSAWTGVAADFVVQDATSGVTVPCQVSPPDTFPVALGGAWIVDPATSVDVTAASALPSTTAPGATLDAVTMALVHGQGAGTADVLLGAMQLRVTDPQGALVAPRDVLAGVELRQGSTIVAAASTLPATPAPVGLACPVPVRIAAGGRIDLVLRAQIAAGPAIASFRFALEGSPFDLVDANDPSRIVLPTGTLPYATATLQIVTAPTSVQLGIVADPPANLVRGQAAATVLQLRVRHPGLVTESTLQAQRLVVHARDAGGGPIAADRVLGGAVLRGSQGVAIATIAGDSLEFDLAAWAPLAAGETADVALDIDVRGDGDITDFRIAVAAQALRAVAGAAVLTVQPLAGSVLPYLSPTIHVAVPDLASTFSNYPNPFAAGREATRIPFYLAAASRVTVEVRTLTGERVIRLLDRVPLAAGLHDDLAWNGRNGRGEVVRNGTYLLLIDVEGGAGGSLRRKLAVVR